ncbi:hypothetical protein SAMD00019534_018490, partial [Acytostelium subglobosum LB1]|uniref:hypothetical protein n=1 Tax=Acytostelium subglobosum LB1 TaxID=1410327 RepID=UPI000644BDA3
DDSCSPSPHQVTACQGYWLWSHYWNHPRSLLQVWLLQKLHQQKRGVLCRSRQAANRRRQHLNGATHTFPPSAVSLLCNNNIIQKKI